MKNTILSILMVLSCGVPVVAGTVYKHFPGHRTVNVYKIETTSTEYKLPPPVVVEDNSITVRYLNQQEKPQRKVVHNFRKRRF